jgi:hypothetical protein
VKLMEPHETRDPGPHPGPHTSMKPLRPSSSFVFIDLREDPEAWVEIENELADDVCFTAH